jgi:hypothetical protein
MGVTMLKYRLSNDPKDLDKLWLSVMRCPKCGYETTVTNICRSCPETPATEELTRPVFCFIHNMYHTRKNPDGSITYLGHQHVAMEYSGYVQKAGTNRKRKFTPKDADELGKLCSGWGVVFEDDGDK